MFVRGDIKIANKDKSVISARGALREIGPHIFEEVELMLELIIDLWIGDITACGDIEIMELEILIACVNACGHMTRMA